MANIIKTSKLSKTFGKKTVLSDLSLEVKEGEVFGYLGPNGAGKSTTIKLLLNFINPTQGLIKVLNLDPQKNIVDIMKNTGYLSGEIHLYENLTGQEHLKYQAGLRKNVDWTYVKTLAERFQSDLSKPIRTLSHGNKQKIALIAAFMSKPRLIILDEPTTGLDPLVQREFYSLVSEVNKSGSTLFISSHILPEVERVCHRVAILREGKLIVTEDIDSLKSKAVRPLEIHFAKSIQKGSFANIEGIKNILIDKEILRCDIVGSLDKFIKELAKYEVLNIITREPDLEQIFLNYYSEKSDA